MATLTRILRRYIAFYHIFSEYTSSFSFLTGGLHELRRYEHVIDMKIWNNRLRCVDSAYG